MIIAILILAALLFISEMVDVIMDKPSDILIIGALSVLLWWSVSLTVALIFIVVTTFACAYAIGRQ